MYLILWQRYSCFLSGVWNYLCTWMNNKLCNHEEIKQLILLLISLVLWWPGCKSSAWRRGRRLAEAQPSQEAHGGRKLPKLRSEQAESHAGAKNQPRWSHWWCGEYVWWCSRFVVVSSSACTSRALVETLVVMAGRQFTVAIAWVSDLNFGLETRHSD